MEPENIDVSVGDEFGPCDDSLDTRVRSRTYLSLHHLRSAKRLLSFARPGKLGADELLTRDALVIGAIFAALAFVEALINEIWEDARDNDMAASLPSFAWINDLDEQTFRLSTLFRYQMTLSRCGQGELDRGRNTYQNMQTCVGLRNALTHYRPRWTASNEPSQIDKALRGRFVLDVDSVGGETPATNAGVFPRGCLTRECGEWVLASCSTFVAEFLDRTADHVAAWPTADAVRAELGRGK